MEPSDPSGIVYLSAKSDLTIIKTDYNDDNGAITLMFEDASHNLLTVKLVHFNDMYYISFGGRILPLHQFFRLKEAYETHDGTCVSYEPDTHITYKQITAIQLMTIMDAVDNAVAEYDIPADCPDVSEPECTASTSTTILNALIPPPNPDTLHSPNSNPLTKTDQVAFLVGILAFLIAILHSVYLALATIKFA